MSDFFWDYNYKLEEYLGVRFNWEIWGRCLGVRRKIFGIIFGWNGYFF